MKIKTLDNRLIHSSFFICDILMILFLSRTYDIKYCGIYCLLRISMICFCTLLLICILYKNALIQILKYDSDFYEIIKDSHKIKKYALLFVELFSMLILFQRTLDNAMQINYYTNLIQFLVVIVIFDLIYLLLQIYFSKRQSMFTLNETKS